jgi:hypothetical protein
MCQAFPGSDYYGGSVALGLASRRRSRIYARVTLSMLRCLVRSLSLFHEQVTTAESVLARQCHSDKFSDDMGAVISLRCRRFR